ncbi:hypothetical protein CDAR_75081 [Caerostris darwini]|uniref:Uncharacterized protein n=1 Tax=Caerostris darwini TaxID=1538125 RepID=A0AAV4MS05_9ARAC|nr:hypothetical protein CDAR_75081 [Caerostris darwini]
MHVCRRRKQIKQCFRATSSNNKGKDSSIFGASTPKLNDNSSIQSMAYEISNENKEVKRNTVSKTKRCRLYHNERRFFIPFCGKIK